MKYSLQTCKYVKKKKPVKKHVTRLKVYLVVISALKSKVNK